MIEIAKQFGLAAPLVIILVYLLVRTEQRERLASEERREMTDKHLQALSTVVTDNRVSQQQTAAALDRLTAIITEEITTSREARAHDREEHRLMLDAIGKATIRSREQT